MGNKIKSTWFFQDLGCTTVDVGMFLNHLENDSCRPPFSEEAPCTMAPPSNSILLKQNTIYEAVLSCQDPTKPKQVYNEVRGCLSKYFKQCQYIFLLMDLYSK